MKSSDYTDVGVRVIQLQNIGDGVFRNESEVYTSSRKADELLSCCIYPDEIILSKMGDDTAATLHFVTSPSFCTTVNERVYITDRTGFFVPTLG